MKIMVDGDGSNTVKAAPNLAKKHAFAFKAEVHVVTSLVGHAETSR
jgi:hypothetical protein